MRAGRIISNRWIALFFVVSLVLFIWLNFFPPGETPQTELTTSLDVDSRQKAEAAALDYIREHAGKGDWRAFASYDAYTDAEGYIAKEQLQEAYDEHWSASVPLDFFRVTVRNSEGSTAYDVYIRLADGRVFGFERTDADDEAASEWTAEDAAALIARMGYDIEQFAFDAAASGDAWVFRHKQPVGEATLSLHVHASDGETASIRPVFDVPASFTEWKEDQDNRGAVIGLISLLLWALLAVAAIVYMAVYRHEMPFSRGGWLTLFFLIPYVIYNVNMYPGLRPAIGYEEGGYAVFIVLFSQFIMLLMAASVYVSLVAGDGLWRRMGADLWPWRRRDPAGYGNKVMKAMGIGYVFTVIVLGLQTTLFYAGSRLFDVWFGTDPMQSAYNLLWPGLFPLLAWSAAISEEAVFRLFAIAFFCAILRPCFRWLHRLTGRAFWLHPVFYVAPAVAVSCLLWALGHTGYSIYPVYTRIVEVTALGIIFSYILLRHGLIAALFTHATVDLIIMAIELISSGSRFAVLGIFYMLMPLLVALAIKLWAKDRSPALP